MSDEVAAYSATTANNPTSMVSLEFDRYLEDRRQELEVHTASGGITDYAFGMDHELRQKIAAMAPARLLVRTLVRTIAPIQKHLHRMEMIAVGPRQFPEIHAIGEGCARRLGIGIPQIFVLPSPELAAYTFATDDLAPMLVLSSALIDALEFEELTFVIGHECGHIHNLHGVYNTAAQQLANPLARLLYERMVGVGLALELIRTVGHAKLVATTIGGAMRSFFQHWSRCAEVTCDRAGLICCGGLESAQSALAKIATGGAEALRGINIEEYVKQLAETKKSPLRFVELFQTHPLIPKRIESLRLFADCGVLYQWRRDLSAPVQTVDKHETDELCRKVLGILSP